MNPRLEEMVAAEVSRQLAERERNRDQRSPETRRAFEEQWRRDFWTDRQKDYR